MDIEADELIDGVSAIALEGPIAVGQTETARRLRGGDREIGFPRDPRARSGVGGARLVRWFQFLGQSVEASFEFVKVVFDGVVDDLSVDVGVAVGDAVADARDRRPCGSESAKTCRFGNGGDALDRGRQAHAHRVVHRVVSEVAPLDVGVENPQVFPGVGEVLGVSSSHSNTASRIADERR